MEHNSGFTAVQGNAEPCRIILFKLFELIMRLLLMLSRSLCEITLVSPRYMFIVARVTMKSGNCSRVMIIPLNIPHKSAIASDINIAMI